MTACSDRHPRPVDELATIVSHEAVNREYRNMMLLGQQYFYYNAPFAGYSQDQLPSNSQAARALGGVTYASYCTNPVNTQT
ncbi:hypothetical protein ACLRDC_07380 [Gluconacetobacter sacchari]|uniref:Uncharacterized protein n=2 Tax=Gluconacetobacter sacchari TaxID=92759 RepID=A0A7W4IEH1_9PROT|nr:hypothetical protein [Gluconacetobacter sacchari]MBB2161257.1 hypothetical protein [Gluconacetobacter sacchari]GBQ22448.1 hypothetical protein AA12717_1190 [Gluconacetobacter sacchari DSM 12717]